jgi:hypothetical protein
MIRKRRNVLVGPFGIVDDDFRATKAKPVSVEERFPHVILADFSLEILVGKGKSRKISNAKHVLLERNGDRAFTICNFSLIFFLAKSSIACCFGICNGGAEETI